ncbi:hypothetical protein MMC18_003568 [Xylographa bjoerkii]|nr:hypothetical protein [Xylographa bjoerkii]
MASKYCWFWLFLQPWVTPLSAQIVNGPIISPIGPPATDPSSTTSSTSPSGNATLVSQPSTTSMSSTTENHYVGPSAVLFTSANALNMPPDNPSCCTTTQPSVLGDSAGTTSACSGTADPLIIYVTSTIVVPETITASDSLFITPTPIYITPIPLCTLSVNSQGVTVVGGPGGDTGPVGTALSPSEPNDIASRRSTILVTKKTPVVIQETPSPTLVFGGGLAKTLDLGPAPAISTPSISSVAPDQESTHLPSSVLAAIDQSIFDSLASSPTTTPPPSSDQSSPDSPASQPDTTPHPDESAPTGQPSTPPSSIVVNNIPVGVASSAIVIGTQTFTPPLQPTPVVISGQTFTLAPSQVIAPGGLTLLIPTPPPTATTATIAGLSIVLAASSAIIGSETYIFTPNEAPLTTSTAGQVITIGPSGIVFPSTTLLPVPQATAPLVPAPTFSILTAGGLTFALNPTLAIISGTTLTIGPSATPTTVTINGETITAGSNGLIFPSTTIPPPSAPLPTTMFSAISVDGMLVSVAPGEVYISGTEYAIGQGATATTVVVGGETVVAGPNGVVMAGTTIAAPMETGSGGILSSAGVRRQVDWKVWGAVLMGILGTLVVL